jgi:predicted Kef-type K+ transport protein
MRNVKLARAIAAGSFHGVGVETSLAAFFALMVTPNMILVIALLGINKFRKMRSA